MYEIYLLPELATMYQGTIYRYYCELELSIIKS